MSKLIHRVLFVCYGNICRSPTAECVLRHRITELLPDTLIEFGSAGTSGMHAGKPADPRTRAAASKRGYVIDSLARKYVSADAEAFDLILAMDRENLEHIERLSGKADHIRLFSSLLDASWPTDVPDPYYGGAVGFEFVLDMIEASTHSLATWIQTQASNPTAESRG